MEQPGQSSQKTPLTKEVQRRFVIVSGLPGSGKTTLARQLAPALNLPLIDKDEILDCLFDSKGVGDAKWRRALSRESDVILQREAASLDGAVLVSFWRLVGMAAVRELQQNGLVGFPTPLLLMFGATASLRLRQSDSFRGSVTPDILIPAHPMERCWLVFKSSHVLVLSATNRESM